MTLKLRGNFWLLQHCLKGLGPNPETRALKLTKLTNLTILTPYIRGGQTTARGQKSARQDIFKCPLKFYEN